jgi:hypothetical protein
MRAPRDEIGGLRAAVEIEANRCAYDSLPA